MKKIKIAFFADVLIRNYDGAIRTMYHIIDRLPQDRFEIKLYCGDPPQHDIPHEVIEVSKLTLPFNKNYKMAIPQFNSAQIKKSLDDYAPDLVHISTPSLLGHFALSYADRNNITVSSIYHTHFISYVDYYLRNTKQLIPAAKKYMTSKLSKFYKQCDRVFVPTQEMMTYLSHLGLSDDKMILWQRGIDRRIFSPDKKDEAYIGSLVGNERPNLLFASRLVWEKNLQTLIDIYYQIEQRGLDYNLLIVGDGVAKNEMMRAMPKAHFTGEVNQETLAMYYASSDVFVFPSISETYGNVVIEAMSCGLPCVIADGGGSKSFISDGNNGFLCAPYNSECYLSHITTLLITPNLSDQFRQNGLEYVSNLDWDPLVYNFYNYLEGLYQDNRMVSKAA